MKMPMMSRSGRSWIRIVPRALPFSSLPVTVAPDAVSESTSAVVSVRNPGGIVDRIFSILVKSAAFAALASTTVFVSLSYRIGLTSVASTRRAETVASSMLPAAICA